MPLSLDPQNPLVVASVNGPDDVPAALAAGVDADIMEWRLDGLSAMAPDALATALAACPRPVLLTARRKDEGGFSGGIGESERLEALACHAKHARWIDVEARTLAASPEWRDAVVRWRGAGIGLVVSWHDFAGVPDAASLALAARIAEETAAEVLKVAATPHTLAEVAALGDVFSLPGPSLRSVMGMGKFGMASRLLFAAAGSVLNYGYLRAASVPGQWPAAQLRRLLTDHRG